MGKGRVLKIFDAQAVFENLDVPTNKSNQSAQCLLVTQGRDNGAREFEKRTKDQLADIGAPSQVIPFEAIFGFYDLLSGSYVALVVESEPYVNSPIMTMRKAKKILVIPLFRHGRPLSESKQADEDRYLRLLNLGFSEHSFFFSYTSDITVTQQRQAKFTTRQITTDPLWSRADLRFFWNRDLVEDLITLHATDDWIVPFMSAYIEMRSDVAIDDVTVSILLISRRSRFRQGCRFTKRGIDEHGAVANFVETEQILTYPPDHQRLTAFVQVRGSIPVKWISPVHMKYEPVVYIETEKGTGGATSTSTPEQRLKTVEYASKHITELIDKYCDVNSAASILMVNLVDGKKDQGKLGVAYKETIDALKPQFLNYPLLYEWFDFHHETKQKGKWNNLSKLIMKVDSSFREMKFFARLANGTVTSWQKGVIRTNCMDNLDRTNVVQSLFARRSLILQVGLSGKVEMNNAHIMQTQFKTFESIFKSMWTNNANAMSMGYTGTGALKADFTKTGKRTLKGMFNDGINSIMRYYINNFTDGMKQDAIDLMIGRYRPNPLGTSPFTQKSSQEAISANITKIFVLLILIFLSLLLIIPPLTPWNGMNGGSAGSSNSSNSNDIDAEEDLSMQQMDVLDRNLKHLQMHFILALVIVLIVVFYLMYKIVKKGSKVGELMVLRPELLPEPMPVK